MCLLVVVGFFFLVGRRRLQENAKCLPAVFRAGCSVLPPASQPLWGGDGRDLRWVGAKVLCFRGRWKMGAVPLVVAVSAERRSPLAWLGANHASEAAREGAMESGEVRNVPA